MKKFLLFFVFLFAIASVMAQNRVMDTLTFYRGGKIYKVRLYSDHVTINDTSYYGFPGFGTDHSHSAYGDHAHSGYEPSISEGRTDQYWGGDKHWQTFPIAITKDSVPWIHTPGNKTVLRNPYDTVITSTIYTKNIKGRYGYGLYLDSQYDSENWAGLSFEPALGFAMYNSSMGKTNYFGNVPAYNHGIMISNQTPTEETRYIFDSLGIHFIDWGPHHTHLKNFGSVSDRWKLYGKNVDLKGDFYLDDSVGTTRLIVEAGYGTFTAKVRDVPNAFDQGLIIDPLFGTVLYNDSNYVGFITGQNADNHFMGLNYGSEGTRVCLGSNDQRWDTTYSMDFNVDPSGHLGFKNRQNPAWWREGLDFGRIDGISLFSQHGATANDYAMLNLTNNGIDLSYGLGNTATILRYENLWIGYQLPELGKVNSRTLTLSPWDCNGILGNPTATKWWDWVYSSNITINDSVYLNNLNTGTSSDSIIVGEAKANFGSVFTNGRTGKTTLLKKVKNTLSNGVTAYNWGNHATMGYLTGISAASYTITVTSAGNCTGNAATVTNGLYTTDRITTTGTSTTKVMTQKAVKDYGDSIANVKSAKADTGANKKNAAYFDMMAKLAGKAATNQSMYLGTTSLAINRGTGALSLAGVNIDGTAGNISLAATAGQSLRYISGAWRAWADSVGTGGVGAAIDSIWHTAIVVPDSAIEKTAMASGSQSRKFGMKL